MAYRREGIEFCEGGLRIGHAGVGLFECGVAEVRLGKGSIKPG